MVTVSQYVSVQPKEVAMVKQTLLGTRSVVIFQRILCGGGRSIVKVQLQVVIVPKSEVDWSVKSTRSTAKGVIKVSGTSANDYIVAERTGTAPIGGDGQANVVGAAEIVGISRIRLLLRCCRRPHPKGRT